MTTRESRRPSVFRFLPVDARPCERIPGGTIIGKAEVPSIDEPIGWLVRSPADNPDAKPLPPTAQYLWHFVPTCSIEPVIANQPHLGAVYIAVRAQYRGIYGPRKPQFAFRKTPSGWKVEVPASLAPSGKRERAFFKTRDKAREFAEDLTAKHRELGNNTVAIKPGLAEAALRAEEILEPTGASLVDAARAFRNAWEAGIYRSKPHHTTRRNFEIFKATDFIAALVDHIPLKSKHTVRYYGVYSNKTRGQQSRIPDRIVPAPNPDAPTDPPAETPPPAPCAPCGGISSFKSGAPTPPSAPVATPP